MLTPCQSFSADSPEHALEPESSSAASEVVLQNKTLLWKQDMRPPFNQKNRKSHLFAMQTSQAKALIIYESLQHFILENMH